jgi:phosphoribosylglycinamide formyltransferase 1
MKHKIAIFLSGAGSNARTICAYFSNHPDIEVALLLTNKEHSGAAAISEAYQIPYLLFSREEFYHTDLILNKLKDYRIDTLVLAGFLWMIPQNLLDSFPNRILNIHPALLPKFGGKGMHGKHVHQAVFDSKETETGITVHLCNEQYDEGEILAQFKVQVTKGDTPESIAKKVQELEHLYYPTVIESYLMNSSKIS